MASFSHTFDSAAERRGSSSLGAGVAGSLSEGASDCRLVACAFPSSCFTLCSGASFTVPVLFSCCCPCAWAFALCCKLSRCCWYQYCCCSYNKQKKLSITVTERLTMPDFGIEESRQAPKIGRGSTL